MIDQGLEYVADVGNVLLELLMGILAGCSILFLVNLFRLGDDLDPIRENTRTRDFLPTTLPAKLESEVTIKLRGENLKEN